MSLCACGCSRPTSSPRATFATDRCRWRTEKRRARAAASRDLEVVVCAVCHRELVRDARTRRRRYHDVCRPVARKLLRDARENGADTHRESSR